MLVWLCCLEVDKAHLGGSLTSTIFILEPNKIVALTQVGLKMSYDDSNRVSTNPPHFIQERFAK